MAKASLDLGQRLCEVLGLNPCAVAELSVHCVAGQLDEVKVSMVVLNEQEGGLVRELRSFNLVPAEEAEPAPAPVPVTAPYASLGSLAEMSHRQVPPPALIRR